MSAIPYLLKGIFSLYNRHDVIHTEFGLFRGHCFTAPKQKLLSSGHFRVNRKI